MGHESGLHFLRYGGRVVFFGRFVAVLRMWAAFLAGANGMPWRRFLACNVAGGIVWAALYGLAGYALGERVLRYSGAAGTITMIAASVITVAITILLHRNERRLADEAERALPGPLDSSRALDDRPCRAA